MTSLNKVVPNNGDARSMLPNKVTSLNPNAAEFVPSCVIRPSYGNSTASDASKSELRGSPGKKILDRSESSKSNNSDDEAHQFWRKQLPDDIIPDFTSFEKIEHEPEELSLAGLSLNAPPFYGTKASRLSREHQELSSSASNLELGHTNLFYEDNSQATFSTVGSSNWEQNYVGDLHFANENQDLQYDPTTGFTESFACEYVAASDGLFDPLEYLASQFPGFSAESLAELYYANGCDFNHTIEILTQLEMQVDPTSNQTMNLTPSSPNFSTGDFPALPTAEDQNGFSKGDMDILGFFSGRNSSTISSGTGDFVSAVRKLASQNSGHNKFKKGPDYGNGVSTVSVPKQYSFGSKTSSGNKYQNVSSARATATPWLDTGDAVANMYSESREEARDFARVRNACFEQARQAYLIGNKALAKELSIKGQAYNSQMKAAHEKAREAIYRQRNPGSLQRGSDRLIDLHGLHVSEAIHILKVELGSLRGMARASGERMQVMVCVGTGHHTKGSRTARLPIAVEQFLLDEGLHYTQPQPGLLRVAVY
ncbi:hypothetical protein CFC21_108044 [Triticum aestivum]|uniref:Smr domain-containing protein n=6 Tax=Triticinae TaxID=1648030 RepID=A0A453R245_AEGTS|nr:polyadenylate-binding protein-interacting protein 7 [Aegilops tauschii subsp. strangulata]XP_044443856.1 polyadenylate-binding protein-interacting protein 7-like [Triticum aestivum]KAF7107418.1 hypothetical protein CFC21_108044 [Triticum aestivum]